MRVMPLVALIIMLAMACDSESTSYLEPQSNDDKKCLSVISSGLETGDYGIRYITGNVRNVCSKVFSYVQVSFNLYDSSGAQVGSALDNINNLEGQGVWKFKAIILEDEATTFKVATLTGF